MIIPANIIQFETDLGFDAEVVLDDAWSQKNEPATHLSGERATSCKDEWDELVLYTCWKEQTGGRYGGGSPAPIIPCSQRQYDGENSFEYCEQMAVR